MVLLEEPSTVGSVESHVMQVLVSLDLDGCILVRVLISDNVFGKAKKCNR